MPSGHQSDVVQKIELRREFKMEEMNPLIVVVTRGSGIESRHRGAAVVVENGGQPIAAWGNVHQPIFPRSAIKPLQALPLIETGAADHFAVTDQEIALACASHGGESGHVNRVSAWITRIGLSSEHLVCGPHSPMTEDAARVLIRDKAKPSRFHNNCSGKHAGFLTTALHMGESLAEYGDPRSPGQRRVVSVLSEMGEVELGNCPEGIDGCNVPVFGLPLVAMARAMARLGAPDHLPTPRAEAARRVVGAMMAHPYLVAGQGRFETLMMEAASKSVMVKGGAEGVFAAALPPLGLGIAIKIDDGAKRAAEVAMAALLLWFGQLDPSTRTVAEQWIKRPIQNTAGVRVGTIGVAEGWPT